MQNEIKKFIGDQLSVWPLASGNFRSLKKAQTKTFIVNAHPVTVQYNPCRIISSTAEIDKETIAKRACFLCVQHRPPEQFHLKFDGRKNRRYNVQVNPYPIFPSHLVIARDEHIPQTIWHHLPDMMDFTAAYPGWTVFYNGPQSGASAPDHLHFQAAPRHLMPLENAVDSFLDSPGAPLAKLKDATIFKYDGYARGIFAFKATTEKSLAKLFYRLLECCDRREGDTEPRFNLYCWYKEGEWRLFVVMRSEIRSHHYYSDAADHLTMSPGAADMAGFFVAPKKEDFEKITPGLLEEMIAEVTLGKEEEDAIIWRLTRTQPKIEVGIMAAKEIVFEIISDGAGPQSVSLRDGKIDYNGVLYDELRFDAVTRSTRFAEPSFILQDVTIGINFHWEQQRTLQFAGSLKFIVEGDRIEAVNCIGVEDYLLSVISSEMKSTSSLEMLKAHAVISRSWAYSRMEDRRNGNNPAHANFDVCADDHCQRYQGTTMAAGRVVREAIDQTWGEVLRCEGDLCDARYSKCCGGTTELYSSCWEDVDYPYLQPVRDNDGGKDFCDCQDESILSQVLNDYDLRTRDFYRWEVHYSFLELTELIQRNTGRKIGLLKDLVPLSRGASGRIVNLRIVGEEGSFEVSKELRIRKVLSDSHLKSSNFEIEKGPDGFTLRGRGWGHGVGLCQIGAAVMASKGYSYKEILAHYYHHTDVGK